MPARIASSASGALPQGAGGRSSAEGARGAGAGRGGASARAGFGAAGRLGFRPRRFLLALLLNGRKPPG